MLDRKVGPKRNSLGEIRLQQPTSETLDSGCVYHVMSQEDCKVTKIELEFDAGTKYQEKSLVASMVNNILLEGTANRSAFEIASFFDSHGAFIDSSCNADKGSIVLHCLEKSVPELVPYVYELVQTATFPKEEIKNYLDVFSQKNTVNQGKVAWVARNEFTEILLGKDNSYCWKLTEAHFKEIDRTDLVEFYEKQYKNSTFQIYLSGKVSPKVIEAVKLTFSGKVRNANSFTTNMEIVANDSDIVVIEKESSVQSAIRLGLTIINRRHEDFAALFIANTILGGYFGSRLMSNIREDKGYTYGIGSGVIHLNELSYFMISTEVGSDFTKKTLAEIEFEMNHLQQEFVSSDELELVKNYILGNIMKGFDGSFSAMERFQMLNNHGLDYSYYENLILKIKQVTPQQIKEVAKQYLNYNALKKVIVGKL